ncbi:MAG: hypothetical protein IKI97_10815 [Clostridia bacterium]|nr:hypothetical protein [Clostridia bacterium]
MKEKTKTGRRKKGVLHSVLSFVVMGILIARFLRGDYYSVFLCTLTLLLFYIPAFVDRTFKVKLTPELQAIILLFIFAAEILGEIGNFYTRIPWWDTMLHTLNGFLMAAIGFAMIDILNNSPRFHFSLSPLFVAFVAFSFSMTVGILWEFFEFGMDTFTLSDMQKDRIMTDISSVKLHPDGINDPIKLENIKKTVLYFSDGKEPYVIENGYLDIGISDTMKDLIVNLIGAVVFSIIGYFYLIGRNRRFFASKFIPQLKTTEEAKETDTEIEPISDTPLEKQRKKHSRRK